MKVLPKTVLKKLQELGFTDPRGAITDFFRDLQKVSKTAGADSPLQKMIFMAQAYGSAKSAASQEGFTEAPGTRKDPNLGFPTALLVQHFLVRSLAAARRLTLPYSASAPSQLKV